MVKVIKFSANWCLPCKILAPKLKEILEKPEFKDIQFEEIDIDKNQEFAKKYNIRSIPTVIVIKDDIVIERIVGMIPDKIEKSLNNILNKQK